MESYVAVWKNLRYYCSYKNISQVNVKEGYVKADVFRREIYLWSSHRLSVQMTRPNLLSFVFKYLRLML